MQLAAKQTTLGFFTVIAPQLGIQAEPLDPLPDQGQITLDAAERSALSRLLQRAQLTNTDPFQLLTNPDADQVETMIIRSFAAGMAKGELSTLQSQVGNITRFYDHLLARAIP